MNGENKGRKIDDVCSQHGTKWNERKNERMQRPLGWLAWKITSRNWTQTSDERGLDRTLSGCMIGMFEFLRTKKYSEV